jgi:hypothetical protein
MFRPEACDPDHGEEKEHLDASMRVNSRVDSGQIFLVLSPCTHHVGSPFSARVIVGEKGLDPSDLATLVESQEKLTQMEALTVDASIPRSSSNVGTTFDLKLTGHSL